MISTIMDFISSIIANKDLFFAYLIVFLVSYAICLLIVMSDFYAKDVKVICKPFLFIFITGILFAFLIAFLEQLPSMIYFRAVVLGFLISFILLERRFGIVFIRQLYNIIMKIIIPDIKPDIEAEVTQSIENLSRKEGEDEEKQE